MRFGLFGSASAARGVPPAEAARGYLDYVEANVEAEALGFHASFLVEHHFTGMGQVSATLSLQQWVAARTTTLRLGTAVLVLPWHNPVLLAEQVATIDLLSGGRLDLGVGRGYRWSEFQGFGMPPEEAAPRFEETLEVLLRALSSDERFSHTGRYWSFRDILVEPPPAQRPHPPVWMAAASEETARRVASRGFNLLLDQFASPRRIGTVIAAYRAELERLGEAWDPMRVAVARNIRIADTPEAIEAAREAQANQHAGMLALSRGPDPGRAGQSSHILGYAESLEATLAHALIGPPEVIAAGLEALAAQGVSYVLVNAGRSARETLRRFAREVMPGFVG
jgi:alkanesulfonate monooxygenase SsuD/methylene tetrahydromethanopterin reductase-like flavin-dependent oxidoreductase (luciferase family)